MAKKTAKGEEKLNYSAEIKRLRQDGPERLYLLWGPEDYLREQYLAELKRICLPEGEDGFSYRRFDGPEVDSYELSQAIDSMPFMSDRTFIELRDIELNKLKDSEGFNAALSDIPDYCTVAIVQNARFEPDGRLKAVKNLRSLACELKFTSQSQSQLINWIVRRFAAAGKTVELDAAQRLIFIGGDLMSRLIPEIEKIAAYSKGEKVTVQDVEAVGNHIPEAVIFDMTEYISQRKYNTALSVLSELLSDKANEPIPMLAMLGVQMRKLYGAKLAIEQGLDSKYVMDVCGIKYEFVAKKLMTAARGFSLKQLEQAVVLCAETDYKMKSGSEDDVQLLKDVVLRIAAGDSHV